MLLYAFYGVEERFVVMMVMVMVRLCNGGGCGDRSGEDGSGDRCAVDSSGDLSLSGDDSSDNSGGGGGNCGDSENDGDRNFCGGGEV